MALDIEQRAYVLHKRPYRETSLLVTFLTEEKGKQNAVVKGVRGHSKSARVKQAWLQPFQCLTISWREKAVHQSDLVNLRLLEPAGLRFPLIGDANICGLYLNELLYRLLYANVVSEGVFDAYQQALLQLVRVEGRKQQAWVLRRFEFELLSELGYGFDLNLDSVGQPIQTESFYRFVPEMGFVEHNVIDEAYLNTGQGFTLRGRCLQTFLDEKLNDDCLNEMKHFFRQVLRYYLGDKPIQTRSLFQN